MSSWILNLWVFVLTAELACRCSLQMFLVWVTQPPSSAAFKTSWEICTQNMSAPATTHSICLCWSQMAFLSLLDVHMIWYWLFHNHIYEPSVQLWPMIIYVWFLVKFCMKVILTFAQWFCPGRLSSKTTASFSISFQLLEADEAVPFIIVICNAAFGNEKYCMVGHTNFLTLFSWGKLEVT